MARPTYEGLAAENERLRRRVAELEALVERLTAQVQQGLRTRQRQAAPFSNGPPKDPPATPGRKAGQAYGTHRPAPRQIPDEVHDAPLPDTCPDCGSPLV